MREIKLRAWDTQLKMFVPQGEIVFSYYGDTRIVVVPNCMEYIGDQCHNGEPQRGRFVIQQYTGLNDKNGNEIYEGDILKVGKHSISTYGFWSEQTSVVSFESGCFIHRSSNGFFNTVGSNISVVEVIGNIYENSQLITETATATQ